MKKLVLLFLFVSICAVVSAQIRWNVKAGIGGTNLLGIELNDSHINYQQGVGIFAYKVGVGADVPFSKKWAFQPVLSFASKGTMFSAYYGSEQAYEGNLVHRLYYLELPLFVAYKLQIEESVQIAFKAGPYLGYGLTGKATVSTPAINDFKETFKGNLFADGCEYGDLTYIDNKKIKTEPLNRFDAGVAVGVELTMKHILFGLESTFGLTRVSDNFIGNKPRNVGIYATVGYQF